jgi:hypothetical protein
MTKPEHNAHEKKPYGAPRLAVYGDLRVLTETMRKTGSDGGPKPASNFSQ